MESSWQATPSFFPLVGDFRGKHPFQQSVEGEGEGRTQLL